MAHPRPLHVMGTRAEHSRRLKGEISTLLASVLKTEPGLSPEEAMFKVEENLKTSNPYMPPKDGACIINALPVELLAHIFRVGVEMQREGGDDDEFEEVEDEQEKNGLKQELKRLEEEEDDDTSDEEEEVDPSTVPTDDNDPEWEDEEAEGDDGTDEEEDEGDEDDDEGSDDESDEEYDIPFEILVSHVCRQWRETAINTPDLWTSIYIDQPHQWDRYAVYLERAKGQTLDLDLNIEVSQEHSNCGHDECAAENGLGDVHRVLDLIIPKAEQWRTFSVQFDYWLHAREFLKRMHDLPGAPNLETFHMDSFEEIEDTEVFQPADLREPFYLPFHGNAPNLRFVKLTSIHIDWDGAVSMFQGLQELDLRFHTLDVLPSWRAFSSYLKNSPQLLRLELHESGPKLPDTVLLQPPATPATGLATAYYTAAPSLEEVDEGGDPYEWPRYPLEVPSVRELMLSNHEAHYALALLTKLHFPNLKMLSLDYEEGGDFTEFVEACSKPLRGVSSRRSLFQTIEALEMKNMGTVRRFAFDNMFDALSGLKHLSLYCYDMYEEDGLATPDSMWIALSKNAKAVLDALKEKKANQNQSVPQTPIGSASSYLLKAVSEPSSSSSSSFAPANPALSIVPPSPSAPLPPVGAGTESAPTPSTAQRDLSSLNVPLLLPNLEGLRTHGISGRRLKRFLLRRLKIGAPLKTLSVHHDDDISQEDERWLEDHLDDFEYFSDSDEEEDADIEIGDTDDEELAEDDEDGEWEDTEDTEDDDGQDEDEDEDDDEEDEDEDDDAGDDGEGGGRVRTRRGPSARATRRGAASMHVTTGLATLD